MIRIRVQVEQLPFGIEELCEVQQVVEIGCKYPIHDEHQTLFVMSGMTYGEFTYDLEHNIYHPLRGKPDFLPLVERALQALRNHKKTRQGQELYPGYYALNQAEFDVLIKRLTGFLGEYLTEIRLFGRRVTGENIVEASHIVNQDLMHAVKAGERDGDFLEQNYEHFVPWDIAITIKPEYYGQMTDEGPYAEKLERMIYDTYSWRIYPKALPDMFCQNGVFFVFVRPNGDLVHQKAFYNIQLEKPDLEPIMEHVATIKRMIAAGKVLFPTSR